MSPTNVAASNSGNGRLDHVRPKPRGGCQPGVAAAEHNDSTGRFHNIRDFGAKGDGVTRDTPAIQAAIDACNKEKGGTVLVPAGDFVIGTIELKSNVTLHLSPQGRLLGSRSIQHYTAGNGIPAANGNIVLVSAANAGNVTIEGPGTIDGNGGGEAENITVSNCVIYDTYGCPIKMRCGAGGRLENIMFSNLIMKNVTGPISIGLDSTRRGNSSSTMSTAKAIARKIAFNGIRANQALGRGHCEHKNQMPGESRFRSMSGSK